MSYKVFSGDFAVDDLKSVIIKDNECVFALSVIAVTATIQIVIGGGQAIEVRPGPLGERTTFSLGGNDFPRPFGASKIEFSSLSGVDADSQFFVSWGR